MAIDKKVIKFIHIPPSGGFSVSKKYILDITNRQIVDIKNNKTSPYDIDAKILVYEDRQKTWFFNIADRLKKNNEAGFVILMIAAAYLESNQQYREGQSSRNGSSDAIKRSLRRIFPQITTQEEDVFINGVRCGLFHDGITKKGVFINASQNDIFTYNVREETLIVNPHKFLESVKEDFKGYIKELKNKREIQKRTNFERIWDNQKCI